MRILFMGTPDFAVASLRRLVADGHEVCGVFTQPDKPKNRGHKLVPTPVKEFALTENIPVYQPLKMRDGTALELVQSLAPELTVVAAYGRILPEDILEAPRYGSINVHSSLLPKYRGAAPINWARSAREIDCQVRGLIPWPCAACELAGQRFKVYRTAPGEQTGAAPGTVLSAGKQGIQVACGRGESLYLTEIQAEGGKRMAAASYLLGHPLEV